MSAIEQKYMYAMMHAAGDQEARTMTRIIRVMLDRSGGKAPGPVPAL
jgi:hypothetical protein